MQLAVSCVCTQPGFKLTPVLISNNSLKLGWISIACWLVQNPCHESPDLSLRLYAHRIVVYSPQIIENYQLQSGEGLSLLFIYVWLLGDVCNLVGAVMAGLLPTVIILGVYVSFNPR